MTMFTLRIADLASIATLAHGIDKGPLAGRTPILEHVQLHVTPERWTATATDRYVVAEVSAPMGDFIHTLPAEGITILVRPADMADAIKKSKAVSSVEWIMLTVEDRPVTLESGVTANRPHVTVEAAHGEHLADYALSTGNFPPVGRLFTDDMYAETDIVALRADFLTRVGRIYRPVELAMRPSDRNVVPMHMRFTTFKGSDKPGPVYITRPTEDGKHGETFRALIQPNLIRP